MNIPKRRRAPKLRETVEKALLRVAEAAPQTYEKLRAPAVEAGQLVREARIAANLTQTELAGATGVPQSAISDLERGVGVDGPTYRTLSTLGEVLGQRIAFVPVAAESDIAASVSEQVATALGTGDPSDPRQSSPATAKARKKLLFVEDDPDFASLTESMLGDIKGFSVVKAQLGSEALELAKSEYFDVMVLDIHMPDMDGLELCRRMRRNEVDVPIIMLTETQTDAETILARDAGADDYLVKPFRPSVLSARLRAQLRQYEQNADAVFTIGSYTFRPSAKLLVHGQSKKKVRLTEKENSILKYLYRSGTNVVGRETLLGEVWGYDTDVTPHALETHVYRLRQKIETDPSNAKLLVTERGGYRLVH
jgi:DNA-binding response OmpR family regulator/DNA-binding XRE family transcriptional regulator